MSMTPQRPPVDEEQKSYAAVFLLGVGLLLAGTTWAVWDDNIARRPWKKYQVEFSERQIGQAREAVVHEQARLAEDPEYQQVTSELVAAREGVQTGETARRLAELEAQQGAAQVQVEEEELALRIVKSRLEEAWYEYDHALLIGAPTEGPHAQLDVLEKEKAAIESNLVQAEAQLQKVTSEMAEIRSVVRGLEEKLQELEHEREQLQRLVDGMVLRFGPFDLPKIPKIRQVVLEGFDRNAYDQAVARVDRCQSCHAGINKVGFDDAPQPFRTHSDRKVLLGAHPRDQFGCTPCHSGQGPAVNSVAQAHGEVRFWHDPLRRGDMVQSSCPSCHSNLRLAHAETIARGEKLFEQLGCHGCHLVEGYGELPNTGPYLRRIGAKVRPAWVAQWIQNPQGYRPHTKMPNFMFSEEQASAIAAYLLSASKAESEAWLAQHAPPAGIDPHNSALVAQGEELANTLGCRGCHGFAPGESPAFIGENKDVAPNLSQVADKTDARWLYHWLKNPRGYSPEARMPSLRLSDAEAVALVSYLLTLGTAEQPLSVNGPPQSPELVGQGEALIRKYGCAGCHTIPGMETESRIGVELSTFGSKPLEEFFFGTHTDIPHTWYDWTYFKLKEPRTYETKRIEQLMPDFGLREEDLSALMVFLRSRHEGDVPHSYHLADVTREQALVAGRRVAEQYNCVGCHVIEQRGGAIRARYEDNMTLAPPILDGEGAKVQSNWLFGFLQHPITLRPWLKVRMPTFGLSPEETDILVDYFLAQDAVEIPFVYVNEATMPEGYVEAGRLLASDDYFSCYSCHQQGDIKPEGPEEGWAPDLVLAKERLNPAWIVEWLRDPQALDPGTKMPAFYNFDDDEPDGPDDILGGNDEKQVEALRDYILTLHDGTGEPPEPVIAQAGAPEEDVALTNGGS